MKVILKEDVYKLGSLGDEINVKDGYARNFLIPQSKAVPVTKGNKKMVEHHRALLAQKRKAAIDEAKDMATKLKATELVFKVKAGESGKLFGSVTLNQIIDALHEQGIDLSKKVVSIAGHIKTLGTHGVSAKLHSEVACDFKIRVEAEGEKVKDKPVEEEATAPAEAAEGEAAAE